MGGSKLDANTYLKWITFKCKSTYSHRAAAITPDSASTYSMTDTTKNAKIAFVRQRSPNARGFATSITSIIERQS